MWIISNFVTNWQFRRIQFRRDGDALVSFAPTDKAPKSNYGIQWISGDFNKFSIPSLPAENVKLP